MDSTPDPFQGEVPLPTGFSTIEKIQHLPSNLIKAGTMINVIGFVKDFQAPLRTKGTDAKCTLEIMDHSIQDGLKVTIFWAEENMPSVCGPADVVVIRNIKVQMWNGLVSLLAHKSSEFYILPATKIPKNPSGGSSAPWKSYPPGRRNFPNTAEISYVICANSRATEIDLPSDHEFQEKMAQSMNVKDKFSLLKDAKPDRFYNIIGEVIKVHASSGSLTVYLSDYTANSLFYHYVWGEGRDNNDGREGDEYGYIRPKKKATTDWPGPYGKMSIQLTLYDEHAEFVRENVEVHTWVLLNNVKIKYGKMGGLLEGFMHGDQGKVGVKVMKQAAEPGMTDTRWMEAVKRKHNWWKKFKEQQKDLLDEAAGLGDKRKYNGEEPSKNGKKRRREKRAALEKKAAAAEARAMEQLDLNENIRCNFADQPIVTFAQILKPQAIIRPGGGQKLPSPFTLCKYRANVRVVDYFPHKIEDFAVGHRASELDMLSDYSGGEDTDPEEEMRIFKSGKGFAKNVWEWRFALQVEDASSKVSKERLWLMVDNHAAQGLLGLEDDATNLRGDPNLLSQVKEQLFKLWGDLEEQKSEILRRQLKNKKNIPPSSLESEFPVSEPTRKAGEMPDIDSDTENEQSYSKPSKKHSNNSVLTERDVNISASGVNEANKSNAKLAPKNKAFTCCIKQYGVKVDEDDPEKADAGDEQRWQRIFGLFGTQIM